MVAIVGMIVVVAAVLGGFTMAGGSIGALIHPFGNRDDWWSGFGCIDRDVSPSAFYNQEPHEGLINTLKGNPFNKVAYDQLFRLLYHSFRKARRDGLLALEPHLANPHDSAIFQRYPKIHSNHHVTEFIRGALGPMLDVASPLINLHCFSIPRFTRQKKSIMLRSACSPNCRWSSGIRNRGAVLGIVITMGAIGAPSKKSDTKWVRHLSVRSWEFSCRTASSPRWW